ncbi:hypothetical protein NT26_0988 [Pseudorhizobium banfieldiae]|uniref:Uncharacterized protein n=1 Tax=Pseudorhizobium banfieldiae TaxID=1125847 RepID=L0NEH7_9HYPH|nr:hypothetical protein RNT25_01374 [arsenite-oxidising bacterium NT-25]CCF18712.1 hypothetical protein NT26_0988 [Pseudorhizobium banfieldiae]
MQTGGDLGSSTEAAGETIRSDLMRLARRFVPRDEDAAGLVDQTLRMVGQTAEWHSSEQWKYLFSVMHQLFLDQCKGELRGRE